MRFDTPLTCGLVCYLRRSSIRDPVVWQESEIHNSIRSHFTGNVRIIPKSLKILGFQKRCFLF